MEISPKIEAILFWKGEPVSISDLVKMTGSTSQAVEEALTAIETRFAGGGITLVRAQDSVELRTSVEVATFIEELSQADLKKDIGKAGLETLATILYQGPISRAEIDYIRGVNSNFILRNLSVRGLIEKIPNPNDKRAFLYQASLDLLAHLGVSKVEDLPDFASVRHELEAFKEGDDDENDSAVA